MPDRIVYAERPIRSREMRLGSADRLAKGGLQAALGFVFPVVLYDARNVGVLFLVVFEEGIFVVAIGDVLIVTSNVDNLLVVGSCLLGLLRLV